MTVSIRDLRAEDLPSCTWAGSDIYLAYVARALGRVAAGEVDYLAVCLPSDPPVAMGGVDYTTRAAGGTSWQLTVHPAWRSRGLDTLLVRDSGTTERGALLSAHRRRSDGKVPRGHGRPAALFVLLVVLLRS